MLNKVYFQSPIDAANKITSNRGKRTAEDSPRVPYGKNILLFWPKLQYLAEPEIRFINESGMFKQQKPGSPGPRPLTTFCHLPDTSPFSLLGPASIGEAAIIPRILSIRGKSIFLQGG